MPSAISDRALERALLSGASQQTRPFRVKTALSDDHLVFRSMRMTEALSTTFDMEVDMLSSDPAIDFDSVLGHNLTVGIHRPQGEERFLNGYVTKFGFCGMRGRLFLYRATVSPWLWMLKQTSNCMIFHDETAISIAEKIFEAHGFADFRIETNTVPPSYEYCVQYRESDFDFISRLFEKEGIYYYFEHENGKHTMVIADEMDVHAVDAGYESIPMVMDDSTTRHRRAGILSWENRQQIRPTKVTLQDYNFTAPRAEMNVSDVISRSHAASGLQLYQYPGEYRDTGEGEKYAKLRVQEQQSAFDLAEGQANSRGLRAGYRFALERHPVDKVNDDYLVISTTMACHGGDYSSGEASENEIAFECSFTAMPLTGRYRPRCTTPKPKIYGPQTAVVSNRTDGEEIEPVDEHGRVTVLFEWEREGKLSCPVRVSQAVAGAGWGSMNIPRHGQEVIVEFEEGNPDRPLITGRVYNARSEFPYNPMDKPTVTTLKTNSSKGGGGFNELRFDDLKGEENIFIHAEKSMDTRVKSTRRTYIGYDDHRVVQNDQFLEVRDGDKHESIGGESRLAVAENISVQTGDNHYTVAGCDFSVVAGGSFHVNAANNAVIDAGVGITLACGGNFITIDQSGISIKGTMVKINSGGSKISGAGEQAQDPEEPAIAKNDDAGEISPTPRGRSYTPTKTQLDSHPVSVSLIAAAESGNVVCKICEQMARSGAA